jgi:hypothetical protein
VIGNDLVRPLFSSPHTNGLQRSTARRDGGRSPILQNSGAGAKKVGSGGPGGGVTTSENTKPMPRSHLTQSEPQELSPAWQEGLLLLVSGRAFVLVTLLFTALHADWIAAFLYCVFLNTLLL